MISEKVFRHRQWLVNMAMGIPQDLTSLGETIITVESTRQVLSLSRLKSEDRSRRVKQPGRG